MLIGKVVSWQDDVLPAWRRANGAHQANSDVWEPLPKGMCWLSGRIEEIDIPRIYVIGSPDWKETFGTYRLADISTQTFQPPNDKYHHKSRILEVGVAYSTGKNIEPIIMVGFSGEGPYVVIDGNHRAVALQRTSLLTGRDIFIGLHSSIGSDFIWFLQAVKGE